MLQRIALGVFLMVPSFVFAKEADVLGGTLCFFFTFLVGFAFYFLPSIIAAARSHPNMVPIVVVNLFLGWLLVGWVIALAWAFTAYDPPGRRYR